MYTSKASILRTLHHAGLSDLLVVFADVYGKVRPVRLCCSFGYECVPAIFRNHEEYTDIDVVVEVPTWCTMGKRIHSAEEDASLVNLSTHECPWPSNESVGTCHIEDG